MAIGYIYKTTNLVNGKLYIGKRQRSRKDNKYFGSGKILRLAIEKYGIDNFKNEVIVWCDSVEELNEKERFYIDLYNKKFDLYNIAQGGEGGFLSEKHPLLGKKHKKETRDKISKSLIGNIPWNKGIKREPIKISYEEQYLKNKCKIPLKITHIKNLKVEYFESRNDFKKKYPEINVKYGLAKGFYKEMIFESISKKEYLSTLKVGV